MDSNNPPARQAGRGRKFRLFALAISLALLAWASLFTMQSSHRQAQRYIAAGMEFVRGGRPADAEREWTQAARITPEDPNVWELLGELYLNTEQWNKGIDAFEHLARIAPRRPFVYSRLAACCLRVSNEIQAQQYALEELKHNPTDESSLNILAFLSGMQDQSDLEIQYLQRLLAIHPTNPETLQQLLTALNSAERYGEMLPIAQRLLAAQPQNSVAYTMRAVAQYKTDASSATLTQAASDALTALRLNPLYSYGRYMLGCIYAQQKKYGEAIVQLELAQKLNPRNLNIPFELSKAYARTGRRADAARTRARFETLRRDTTRVSVLQKQCSLNKSDFDAFLELGKLLIARNDYRQATYYLQRALVLRPDNLQAKQAYAQLVALINSSLGPDTGVQTARPAHAAP